MFKNALVYRLQLPQGLDLAALEDRLAAARFTECGPTQTESAGWVEPRGERHAPLVESVAGQWLLELRGEARAVPGGVVRERLAQALDRAEQETGRRPRGRAARDIKEQLVHELLPRAFPKRWSVPVWVDPDAQRVVLGTTSVNRADRVLSLLVEALGAGTVIQPLQTQAAPATAMSRWLSEREAPAGFSLDRDCVLEQPDSDKAAVRYTRHNLDIEEVGRHIAEGKLPTQLALTWGDRVSLVLTGTLALKRIKMLDGVLDGVQGDEGGFDTDAAIATGELRALLADLLLALDGEREQAPEASPVPAEPSEATA